MRLTRVLLCGTAVAGLLAGCGGSSDYASGARTTVSKMRTVLTDYNTAPQRSLAQTGRACTQAENRLGALNGGVDPKSAPSQYRHEVQAIHKAYQSAIQGFTDCERGALYRSYPLMAQSGSEIDTANSWLKEAAHLDRA
jgi:hypothetical protein